MAKRNVKSMLLAMGKARRGQRDDRTLPPFNAPRTGPHTALKGRGAHKAKRK